MAAYTSSQSGPWSDPATWGGSGPPVSGDTATIGAHTVTLTANAAVGTSPNDTTTKAIDMTSASSVLDVSTFTLVVKGNIGAVNGSEDRVGAGGKLEFDASASGGTPAYTWVNVGFGKHTWVGTSGSKATVQAVSGYTFTFDDNLAATTITHCEIRRCSTAGIANLSGALAVADTLFDTCAVLSVSSNSGTIGMTFDRVDFQSGTGSGDLTITHSVAYTSGTRRVSGCKLRKLFTYAGRGFGRVDGNYFGGGVTCTSSATVTSATAWRNNVSVQDGGLNGGNGALFPFSTTRNYWVVENGTGNPHFVAPTALVGSDNTVSQSVFESQCPDLVDFGDCLLVNSGATSGGNVVVARNNIAMPSGYTGATCGTGTLLTIYNNSTAAALFKGYRNTVCVNNPASGTFARRGAFAVAEANNGAAGQVSELKGNSVFGTSSGQGYIADRVKGAVQDHITASGCTHNWTHNTTAGDNTRGFESQVGSGDMWAAGNATAADVNASSGDGDPQHYDAARNAAAWCAARGYGAATFAAAKTALIADPTRAADLIDYVFGGFKPQASGRRTAAHDGTTVGAANWHDSTRSLSTLNSMRAYLAAKYPTLA